MQEVSQPNDARFSRNHVLAGRSGGGRGDGGNNEQHGLSR